MLQVQTFSGGNKRDSFSPAFCTSPCSLDRFQLTLSNGLLFSFHNLRTARGSLAAWTLYAPYLHQRNAKVSYSENWGSAEGNVIITEIISEAFSALRILFMTHVCSQDVIMEVLRAMACVHSGRAGADLKGTCQMGR